MGKELIDSVICNGFVCCKVNHNFANHILFVIKHFPIYNYLLYQSVSIN